LENPRFPFIKRVLFTRVPIDILEEDQLTELLSQVILSKHPLNVVLLRFRDYSRARRDKEFLAQLNKAALVLPFDKSILNGMRFLGLPNTLRMHSFDLLIRMLGILEEKGQSLFVVGGNYQDIQAAAGNLRTSFPKINLVGRHTGFFKGEAEDQLITAIQKATPGFLFLGTGIPHRHRWAIGLEPRLSAQITLYAPEAFQIVVGKAKRPNREDFQIGKGSFVGGLLNPFKWWKIFPYTWYGLVLLVYKIFKKKNKA
jgi:N-acetylglucosaminyldiphosphoundecaprenol N-acetyl-beta-D-mannosaminyltransferase